MLLVLAVRLVLALPVAEVAGRWTSFRFLDHVVHLALDTCVDQICGPQVLKLFELPVRALNQLFSHHDKIKADVRTIF